MKFLLLSALVAVALSQPLGVSEHDLAQWELFKIEHVKEYESEEEEQHRKLIFLDNLNFVREHNTKYKKGEVTFDVAINQFADMTNKEFAAKMTGYRRPVGLAKTGETFTESGYVELPDTVDWRQKGAVTAVKDQGKCGSSWAFSATGSLEGQSFLKTKKLVSLSEQNLVDCSIFEGNVGCNGGSMDAAFDYVDDNYGIDTESSYPYEAHDDTCRYNASNKGATITGYVDIPSGSERSLQVAVANVGPISVAIDASQDSFQFYKSGVYKEYNCSSLDLDHAALVVGYGTDRNGGAYWLVKNSWGTSWGMNGYIMMARRHDNMCGIATSCSYPTM